MNSFDSFISKLIQLKNFATRKNIPTFIEYLIYGFSRETRLSPSNMLNSREIKEFLAEHFDLVGICPAVSPEGLSRFHQWLDSGYAGEMDYLPNRKEAYSHPRHVLDGVRSIIMLGSKYALAENSDTSGWKGGRVARYARSSNDYHDVVHQKLKLAKRRFQELSPDASFRGVVDTAPLLEREFAQLAGLGWQGKNTLVISKSSGSWFFLSAILTDVELEYDQPFEAEHCGTCTACLDACPTNAFAAPFVLDARRCISYWNIESRNLADNGLRSEFGDWMFGCDICQEVCPWNRKEAAYVSNADGVENQLIGEKPGFEREELIELLYLDDDSFRGRFRKTPFWRSKRRGIIRNVLVVMGNSGDSRFVPHISARLQDSDAMVRAASAWALGEFNVAQSRLALKSAIESETETVVIAEIQNSLRKNG